MPQKMQNPTDILKAMTKWFFAHLVIILFSLAVTAIVLYFGGIYKVSNAIWSYSKILLPLPTPLWATIALSFLSGLYIYKRTSKSQSSSPSKKPKYFKYCPECDLGINAKRLENYCQCGTKYLEKCPECHKKITRDSSRSVSRAINFTEKLVIIFVGCEIIFI